MRKIFLAAGLIIIILLLLGAWFFIGGLGGWSQLLGQKSQQTFGSDIAKLMGTWYGGAEYGSITFFSVGTFRKGVFDGEWKIESSTLMLYGLEGSAWWTSYTYVFSEEDTVVTLSEKNTGQTITLEKQG